MAPKDRLALRVGPQWGPIRLLQLGLPAMPPTNPASAEMAGEFMLRAAGLDITRCPHWTYPGAPTDG